MKLQHKHARYIQGESLIQFHTYPNGRQAIQLVDPEDGCPNCVASVNLPDEPCPEGHCYLKTYSENEGIAEDLIEAGIVSNPVAFSVQLGAPLVRILPVAIKRAVGFEFTAPERDDEGEHWAYEPDLASLTCFACPHRATCDYVDDPYNTNGDCLALK
jgi:hypothetical protein